MYVIYIFIIPLLGTNKVNIIEHNFIHYENRSTNLHNYDNLLFKNRIFMNDVNYNSYYNNLSVFHKKVARPISLLTNMSPESSDRNRIGFFCAILLLIFLFKTKRKPIFNLFCFGMLFFIFNNVSLHIGDRDKDLNSCTNLEFFTIESIHICNNIKKYHLKNDLNFAHFF